MDLVELFCYRAVIQTFISIYEGDDYPSLIVKNHHISFSAVFDVCKQLNDFSLIVMKKEGRITKLYHTNKGKQLYNYLKKLLNLLKSE